MAQQQEENKSIKQDLRDRLSLLFRSLIEKERKAIVIVEGSDLLLVKRAVRQLSRCMNPIYFRVIRSRSHPFSVSSEPFLYPYWMKAPRPGHTLLLSQGYYRELILSRVRGKIKKTRYRSALDEIYAFERAMEADGVIISRYFLESDKKEIKEVYSKEIKSSRWKKVTGKRIKHSIKYYEKTEKKYKSLISRFAEDDHAGTWTVIPKDSYDKVEIPVLDHLVMHLEQELGVDSAAEVKGFDEAMSKMRKHALKRTEAGNHA